MKDMDRFFKGLFPGWVAVRSAPRVLIALFLCFQGVFYSFPCVVAGGDTQPSISKDSLKGRLSEGHWNPDVPVDIQSEQMTLDFDAGRIIFQGDVKVTQADFFLTAQRITAIFGENAEDIEKIIAKGDVTIRKTDKMGWGQEAIYDRGKAIVRLTGDPYLKQGKNYIKGTEICVFLDEDRMDVKGAVEAEFRLTESESPFD